MDDEKAQALKELRLIRGMMETSFRDDNWPLIVIWSIGSSTAALLSQWLADHGLPREIPSFWLAVVSVCWTITFVLRRGKGPIKPRHGLILSKGVRITTAVAMLFIVALMMVATWMKLMPAALGAGIALMLAGTMFCVVFFATSSLTRGPYLVAALAWWVGGIAMMKWPGEGFLILSALFLVGFLLPGYLFKLQAHSRGAADVAAV
ncbi:MAG: hypothetical protein ACLQDV_03985 [Candidatus Binataceae bacterium]